MATGNGKIISNSGFTLPEVMVAIFVLTFLALGATSFSLTTMGETYRMQQRSAAEESLVRAEYLLRRYLSLAVAPPVGYGAGYTQNSIATVSSRPGATAMHQINLYNYNRVIADPNSYTAAIAYFIRENGSAQTQQSDLWTSAIFYRLPTQTQSGALIIDTGANVTNSATYQLAPNNSDQIFDKFVEFDTSQPIYSAYQESDGTRNQRIAALKIRMVVRYFTTPDQQNWRWCPSSEPASTSNCTMPKGASIDLAREITIALYNNVIGFNRQGAQDSSYNLLPERVGGNVYMFAPLFPSQSFR